VSNACGSAISANTITVTITTSPSTPIISGITSLCEGETLNLSTDSVPGASYNWIGPFGSSVSTQRTVSISGIDVLDAGTYTVTVSVGGCPSAAASQTVVVFPAPPAPIVTVLDDVLTATGFDIQWYLAGQVIPGATNNIHIATESGWYYAVTTEPINGCSAGSDSVFVQLVGIDSYTSAETFAVYPNPADNFVLVDVPQAWEIERAVIIDVAGKVVQVLNPKNIVNPIEISSLAEGLYFIRITTSTSVVQERFVIAR
jgi:hypothetical protein